MGHAVYHRTASGEAQLDDVSSLEAALELVERLRNEEGPTDVRLFKEIKVEVRTYYRVVAADEGEATQETAEVVTEPATADATEVVDAEGSSPTEVEAAAPPAPVPSTAPAAAPSEPPAGAMPLLSPPPPVTVHGDDHDDDAEPATASASSGRPKLFNRN
jgi:hypothetical protein